MSDENPYVREAIEHAQRYAHDLRDQAHQLADTPNERSWRRLRWLTGNVDRWRDRLATAITRLPDRPDELTGAYLQLVAAINEASSVIDDLAPLYRDRTSPGAARQEPALAGYSRPFVVRYGATCAACGGRIEPGQHGRYDPDSALHHDGCAHG